MKEKDGGQAFPVAIHSLHVRGLSVRDYFAGQALAGLLVKFRSGGNIPEDMLASAEKGAAMASYRFADAMLAEREKP